MSIATTAIFVQEERTRRGLDLLAVLAPLLAGMAEKGDSRVAEQVMALSTADLRDLALAAVFIYDRLTAAQRADIAKVLAIPQTAPPGDPQ
jgi:hypothetical protein